MFWFFILSIFVNLSSAGKFRRKNIIYRGFSTNDWKGENKNQTDHEELVKEFLEQSKRRDDDDEDVETKTAMHRNYDFNCDKNLNFHMCIKERLLGDSQFCQGRESDKEYYWCWLREYCDTNDPRIVTSERCLDCSKLDNAELAWCKQANTKCTKYYFQMQNERTDKDVPLNCLTWLPPHCDKGSEFGSFHVCTDCFIKDEHPPDQDSLPVPLRGICSRSDCTLSGKDRGWDICEHFVPNCKNAAHVNEDACLDCGKRGRHETDRRCLLRNCTRLASDRLMAICKTWKPDCGDPRHQKEDICLRCQSEDENDPRCLEKEWDCDGDDAKEDICYYSTTSTEFPFDGEQEFPNIWEVSRNNDTNLYLKYKQEREDYFTEVTVPTFCLIALTVMILYLLLHLPKCCCGVFREPDWETYGCPKEEEFAEDHLFDEIVKK